MKAVIQRVSKCSVRVDERIVGSIGEGFMILLGVEDGDEYIDAEKLASKIAVLRLFSDENDKMNLSLLDTDREALVVSQFTLCADCRKGRRPNFISAAPPSKAIPLYEYFCKVLKDKGVRKVETGEFGADMKVELVNDGPVTVVINSHELA